MPSNHLILCHPPPLLPSIFSSIRVFSNESVLGMRWPKYWGFSFSIIPSKEIPGLIFRMAWLDLHALQGTLKSLLQHHSSKASILRHSAFFTVQLPHPYMTTGNRSSYLLKRIHKIQHVMVPIAKIYYAKRIHSRIGKRKKRACSEVQRTLKSLLQHHSSKASILQSSAFFTVQLPHPYMTTGKTIALTR